jgi:hypothetical protein
VAIKEKKESAITPELSLMAGSAPERMQILDLSLQ